MSGLIYLGPAQGRRATILFREYNNLMWPLVAFLLASFAVFILLQSLTCVLYTFSLPSKMLTRCEQRWMCLTQGWNAESRNRRSH